MLELSTLRAGEIGTGYLIEQDAGYISPSDERNLPFINEIKNLERGKQVIVEPLYVYAVLQKYGIKNRNGRVYPEAVLRTQEQAYQQLIQEKRALGELDHPESSIISGSKVSHNIVEMWWEGNTLMGKLEILMTPGFVNLGIASTMGDHVANLLRLGIKVGVSSRGVGSVEDVQGVQLVQSDFELICWDVVTNPSTPGSWIFNSPNEKAEYQENVEIIKPSLLEGGLDKFLLN